MRTSDIMTTPVVTVAEDATLDQVARIMLERNIGAVPVVSAAGKLSGIITHSDFSAKQRPVPFSMLRLPNVFGHWLQPAVEQVYEEARRVKARSVMTRNVVTVREDDAIEEAIRLMCESNGSPTSGRSRRHSRRHDLQAGPAATDASPQVAAGQHVAGDGVADHL